MYDKALRNYLQDRENREKEETWKRAVEQFHREFPADSSAVTVVADEVELCSREEVIQSEPDDCKPFTYWQVYANSTERATLTIEVSLDGEIWRALQYYQLSPMCGIWQVFIPSHDYIRACLKNVSNKNAKILLATRFLEKIEAERSENGEISQEADCG